MFIATFVPKEYNVLPYIYVIRDEAVWAVCPAPWTAASRC